MPEWRPIKDFEGRYEVSDSGQVRSLDRYAQRPVGKPQLVKGRVLRQSSTNKGYPSVILSREGITYGRMVHTLVAEAFIGPRPDGHHICHFDGNKFNNTPANLRYDTPVANADDRRRHGIYPHDQPR